QSGNINKLESELNNFLEDNPHIETKDIKQTGESYGDAEEILSLTTISIWYEEEE
ncbi:TPA: hypothetical protein OUC92_003214, partial [Enterococcus faecalis]|nr:hypothetical protein [Enterococcus faecalis]